MNIYIYNSIRFAKPGGPVSGFLVSRFWFLGSRVPWFPGPLVPWFPSSLVPWSPGSLVPKFLGSLVSWAPGSLVSWFPGSLVPWFPVLCRWISLAEAMKNKSECLCFFDFAFFVWGVHSLSIFVEFQWFWVNLFRLFWCHFEVPGCPGVENDAPRRQGRKRLKKPGVLEGVPLRMLVPF